MIVGYNGNTNESYRSIGLVGVIPGQQGEGAIAFDFVGLQNGAPDGVALVAPDGGVIEFLSYEGVIQAAADGPALGMSSRDIEVQEDGATEVGHSLQRSSSGWLEPGPASRGEVNPQPPPS